MKPLISSFLHDDLYKFTMFQAVFNQFPRARARYKLQDRQIARPYPKDMNEKMKNQVSMLADLHLTKQEHSWLKALRFSKPTCCDYLMGYRYDPAELQLYYDKPIIKNGYKEIGTIEGEWYRTIWWEVKLLLLTSSVSNFGLEKLSFWKDRIAEKADNLNRAGMNWIDFGTRRAFDMTTQDEVVRNHKRYYTHEMGKTGFRGTSNMYLAMINDITCNGSIAHEFFMAMQALYSLTMSNKMAMEHWIHEYDGDLGLMLPDTLTTDTFLRSFDRKHAKLWDGPRLDSGNLLEQAKKFVETYRVYGINPLDKVYLPSDSLTDEKAIRFRDDLNAYMGGSARVTAGIGTFFVNDVGYEPRSIVCKLDAIDFGDGWVDVVKLGDAGPVKYSGNPEKIEQAKMILGLK